MTDRQDVLAPSAPPAPQSDLPTVAAQIYTPDRRVRVFISSTLRELATERRGVRSAVTRLRLTPVMFELGARPHPPRELYRSYLAQSDVFVGIYWQSYGWVAPDESVSGLEDEYQLAGSLPKLIYVKEPAPDRDAQLTELLRRVKSDDHASYKAFTDADELTELLADDLALLLTERFAAVARPAPSGLRQVHPPAPTTAIIGRDGEVARLRELVLEPGVRLVTVVGPGGIGKTRLALEVARDLAGGPDPVFEGVWFVDLAPVTHPLMVPSAIAAALGVQVDGDQPVLDLLIDRLATRRVLLVLDNVEQVLPAGPDIARLLAACPRLVVLASSRSALRLRGEHEFPLAPLPEADGVALFTARAEQVRPDLPTDPASTAAVAEIVRRLDGIPLAIELAAAQVRALWPAALLRRLSGRLDLREADQDLPERQRTLRATLDWSYGLLSPEERVLLARLAAFGGGWTLDAVEAVGGDGEAGPDVLATLSSLVAQSMVRVEGRQDLEPRFRLLDTVREYGGERLAERGERNATMRRLADYLQAFSARAGDGLNGSGNREWTARVDVELDALRAAQEWAVTTDDAETVVRLAAPLPMYWWTRGLLREQLALAERTAALPSAARLPGDAEALLLWSRGAARIVLGRLDEAAPLLRRLLELATARGDDRLRAHALTSLALTLPWDDHADEIRAMLDEAVATFRRLGDVWGVAYTLTPLGQAVTRAGDIAGAAALHREALAQAELIDNDHLRAQALDELGFDALLADSGPVAARGWFLRAAEIHRRLLDREGLAYCLEGFATIALAQGRGRSAARLVGAAHQVRAVAGVAVWPLVRPWVDALAASANAAAGPAAAEERAAGAALPLPEALDLAAHATDPDVSEP